MNLAFRITRKITLFARKIKHQCPIITGGLSQFPPSLLFRIILDSYLIDNVFNPLKMKPVEFFTFFLQRPSNRAAVTPKFASMHATRIFRKVCSKISLSMLLLIGSVFVTDHALSQDGTPWWKSIFQGTSQTEVQKEQMDENQEDYIAAPAAIDSSDSMIKAEDSNAVLPDNVASLPRPEGALNIQCDPRVLALDSAWHREAHPVQGYRIQIFSGSLQAAREVRAKARKLNADSPAYLSAMPPNYRVTIGDFRTKWEARQAQDLWSDAFPLSIVIPMEINLPPL